MEPEVHITAHAWHRYTQRAGRFVAGLDALLDRVRQSIVIEPPPTWRNSRSEYWHDVESGVVWVMRRASRRKVIAITCLEEKHFMRECDQSERVAGRFHPQGARR